MRRIGKQLERSVLAARASNCTGEDCLLMCSSQKSSKMFGQKITKLFRSSKTRQVRSIANLRNSSQR